MPQNLGLLKGRGERRHAARPGRCVYRTGHQGLDNEAVLPGSLDKVYELVIDLVLTAEAEQLGQRLIEEWVVNRLRRP